MARIILLNGVSSAGKTSLAKAFQEISAQTCLHISMDMFISMLPSGKEAEPEWFPVERGGPSDNPAVDIRIGLRGAELLRAMRRFVVDLANCDTDCILDDVCTVEAVVDLREILGGHEFYAVKVFAPLDTLAAREEARGDRLIGLAKAQAAYLHAGIIYDASIDTSDGSPKACARRLLEELG